MTFYYMDTSALVKRYITTEIGSAWIRSLIVPANTIVICELTPVEFFSAVARRERRAEITPADAVTLRTGFIKHYIVGYLAVALELSVTTLARDLVTRHPLRTLDAMQLASALEFQTFFGEPVTFLSADNVLLAAAASEGLAVDNPLSHP